MPKFEEFINTEIPIKKELLKVFDKDEPLVIFDIGACEGEDSLRYSKLFKNSTIYSFEPLPSNFGKFSRNLERYSDGRIKPYQLAISNKNGISKLFVSSGNPEGIVESDWDFGNKSSSLYPPDPLYKKNEWLKFNEHIEIKTQTISSFCDEQSIQEIDFIHLDVQGAELDVLKSAGNKLNTVRAIWLEVENVAMYKGQPLKKDIEKFMKKSRFIKVIDTAFGDSGDQLYLNAAFFLNFRLLELIKKIEYKIKLLYFKIRVKIKYNS